jgi:uncharacterized integral membrane protein
VWKEQNPMRARAFLAVIIGLLITPAVAQAKGPDQATISGPGMTAPISISGSEGAAGDLSTLVELAGLFPAAFAQIPDPLLAARPDESLGPKLSISWRIPDGSSTPATVHQDLYLYAEGGPLTYTAPGQQLFTSQRTHGGWFRTPAALRSRWTVFGLPARNALEAPAQPMVATATATSSASGPRSWPAGAAIAAAVVCGAAITTFRIASRRRVRVGSTPP